MPVVLVSAVRARTRPLAIAGLRAAASWLANPSPQGGLSRRCLPPLPSLTPAGCRLASDTREFVPATTPAANFRYPVGTPVYCCACPDPFSSAPVRGRRVLRLAARATHSPTSRGPDSPSGCATRRRHASLGTGKRRETQLRRAQGQISPLPGTPPACTLSAAGCHPISVRAHTAHGVTPPALARTLRCHPISIHAHTAHGDPAGASDRRTHSFCPLR